MERITFVFPSEITTATRWNPPQFSTRVFYFSTWKRRKGTSALEQQFPFNHMYKNTISSSNQKFEWILHFSLSLSLSLSLCCVLTSCNVFSALVCRCQCPCCTLTSTLCYATERCIPLHVKQGQSARYSSGIWFRVLSASKLAGCNSYNFNGVRNIAKSNSIILM